MLAAAADGLVRPYLAQNVDLAWYYAEQTAEEDWTDPVVVLDVTDVSQSPSLEATLRAALDPQVRHVHARQGPQLKWARARYWHMRRLL